MDRPVCSRTRSKEALMFRKLHEEIRKKKFENGTSSCSSSRNRKISSNSSSNYLSSCGFKNLRRKNKRKRRNVGKDNVDKDLVFDDDSVKDSNLGSAEFDLGSSNFDSSCIKKVGDHVISPRVEAQESCSGTKYGNLGILDSVDNKGNEVIDISDGSVELCTDDEFQTSLGESEDDEDKDEDYIEEELEHFGIEKPSGSLSSDGGSVLEISSGNEGEEIEVPSIRERGKRDKIESPMGKRDRFRVSSDEIEVPSIRERGKREKIGLPMGRGNRFQVSAKEIEVPSIIERGKREKLESLIGREKRFRVSSDDEDDRRNEIQVYKDEGRVVEFKPKRKKFRAMKHKIDIVKILGNSMFKDNEEEEDEVVIVQPESPKLQQKFLFGVKVAPVIEKTAAEIEEEELWAEMNLALCGQDTPYKAPAGNLVDTCGNVESTVAENCSQGKHFLILEEQIGVICKYCGFVQQEIRDYSVPFNKNPFGRSDRRGSYKGGLDGFGKINLNDFDKDDFKGGNIGHGARGIVWDIIPGLQKDLHPHQRDGFEFLWRNIGGSIDLDVLKKSTSFEKASGCIISHAPGTGKTRLAIVFVQSYMKMYPSCKPVIIAPCGMLLYWESEFKKWNFNIPFHNLNDPKLSYKENKTALKYIRTIQPDKAAVRMVKLFSWKKDRSVLALSYKLFEELVGEEKIGRRVKTKDPIVQSALIEVPNLLVLDEGHTPRNDQSQIWKALSKIQTTKRIILSGTPFQNNFDELYNTICLARPQFADSFTNESGECLAYRRLKNGTKKKWHSLTGPIGKDNTNYRQKAERLEKVRDLISPFVHIHEGNILQHKLPGLRSAAIILQPDELQKRLLEKVNRVNLKHFEMEYLVSVVSVHPSLMPEKLTNEHGRLGSLKFDTDAGAKTKFLMELIRISVYLNEKVLVFSQFIEPLKLISQQLIERFRWIEGREVLCMYGSTEPANRQIMIKNFNNEKNEAKVMLASTRACSEGINLVGASRVVFLDVLWNPSVERQAISRAYRLGQTKIVHIYHLLTCETMEEDKYCRQARKEQLSDLVFYSSEKANNEKLSMKMSDDKKDKILEAMVEGDRLKEILKKIIYEPKASFNASFGLLRP